MPKQVTITPQSTAQISRLGLVESAARDGIESANFYGGGCGSFSCNCNCFAEED
jgi:hypothetical protein